MLKGTLLAITVVLFIVVIGEQSLYAQETPPKVEVGGMYTTIRSSDGSSTQTFHGFGGIFALNFSKIIGADTQFNFIIPKSSGGIDVKSQQGFFGVKSGWRSEKLGIFGKFRPGYVRTTTESTGASKTLTNFAMDVGGVFELYASPNLGFRLDIGDTIIKATDGTTNNLQIGAGVLFRF